MNPVFSKHSDSNEVQCAVMQEFKKIKSQQKEEDQIVLEVRNIIKRSIFSPKSVLQNLDIYHKKNFYLDDEDLDAENIYTLEEIEKVCVKYRMSFLDIVYYKKEIPSVAEIKVMYLNDTFNKNLQGFKVLSYRECFTHTYTDKDYGILFAPTLNGHYYMIHQWGKPVPKWRKWQYLPLRNFETLAISVILFTLIVDLLLPTHLITLDRTAGYWSGYRLGVYFHLLIFFSGLTMFFVIGFFRNVSKNIWNTP